MLALATLVASLAVGCNRQLPDQPDGPELQTFTCVIADSPESRVSISDQGKSRWEPGDQILVHGEYTGEGKSATVTLTASDISSDGKTATITFSGVAPYDRTDKGYTSNLYAGYPASAVPMDEHCYYYTNFRSTNVPLMAAYNEGNKFVFYNLCGVKQAVVHIHNGVLLSH